MRGRHGACCTAGPRPQRGFSEGKRPWWVGRASNPVGGAMRRRVGSTPIPLRHEAFIRLLRDPILRLRFSSYESTTAMLTATSGRSRRRLNASCPIREGQSS